MRSVPRAVAAALLLLSCSSNGTSGSSGPPAAGSSGMFTAGGGGSTSTSAGGTGGSASAGAGAGGTFAAGATAGNGASGAEPSSGGANAGAGASASQAGSSGTSGASSGGATNGGATNGGGSAALFTDGFEAATIGSAWVPRINGAGSFELSTAQKHGGLQSLHPKRNNGYSTLLAIEGAPIFPAPNNTFYGRVWLRVSGSGSTGKLSTQHLIWMEAGDVTNDTHEVRIGANLGYFQVNLFHNGEVDLRAPDAALTVDAWHCVEFEMGTDDLEIWLDGLHIDALSTKNWVEVGQGNGGVQASSPMSNWSPTYAAFRLGWELSSGDDNGDIFYDDVALGHERLGCQ